MNKTELSIIIGRIMDESLWSLRFPVIRTERIAPLAHPRHDPLPMMGGLYRIHMEGAVLAYVGQSGNIRRRVNELKGIGAALMPFTDPHIAAPSLWAYHQIPPHRPYTVTYAAVSDSPYWRQGLEDLVIAHARWKRKCTPEGEGVWHTAYSPLANFHKMPLGWVSSSSRSKGYRGGLTPFLNACHTPSIAPIGDLDDPRDPNDLGWGGHEWSDWCDPHEIQAGDDPHGLYRLRETGGRELLFIGHGSIHDAARNAAYMNSDLHFSYVAGPWLYHERLELLTDALALYLCGTQSLPLAQYGGEDNQHAGSAWPLRSLTDQTVSFLKRFISGNLQRQMGVLHQGFPALIA